MEVVYANVSQAGMVFDDWQCLVLLGQKDKRKEIE